MYLKHADIDYLNGKKVQQFNRGASELLFVENDSGAGSLQFGSLEMEKSEDFSNAKISFSGAVKLKEVIEF